jgi:hypothetical protein
MQTITVIIRDNRDPLGDPLIYSMRVVDLDRETVLCALIAGELFDSDMEPDDIDLLFAFRGEQETIADWRE